MSAAPAARAAQPDRNAADKTPMHTGTAVLRLGSSLALGCIGAPPLAPPDSGATALTATDFAGESAVLAELPRRPHLHLHHPNGFAQPLPLFLFENEADPDLVADLER